MTPAIVAAGGGPFGVAVSPDGKSAYVTNLDDGTVSQYTIDPATGALSPMTPATVGAGSGPFAVAVSPDGISAYVADETGNTVSQYTIDPATGALSPMTPATVPAGGGPSGIAVSPDGKSAYVTNQLGNTVSQYAIDSATGALSPMTPATVAAGSRPIPIAVTPIPLSIAKAFGAGTVPLSGTTSLTFTITNPSATAQSGVAFADTFPSGLVVSTPNGLSNACGGTATAAAAGSSISLTGGSIAAGSSCKVVVNVTGTTAGDKSNTSGPVSSAPGLTGNTASATLTVVAPPSIAKAFSPTQVNMDGTSTLTFTLTNPSANTVAESGVAFSDTLPSGLVVGSGLSTSCGGSVVAVTGSDSISLTGGSIAVGSSCTIAVKLTAMTVGVKNNTSGAVSSTNGGTGNTATATLTVVDADLALVNVPADMTVDATGSAGAVVSYTPPTATDEGGETPTVGCVPASGSTFAIGTTTVTCTATDADDLNSPVHATFTVTVTSALGQLQNLLASVAALPSSTAKTVLSVQLGDAVAAEQGSNTSRVCLDLFGLVRAAEQEQSYGQLTSAQATSVINAAEQIEAVVGCGGVDPAPVVLRPVVMPAPAVTHSTHKRHHGSRVHT